VRTGGGGGKTRRSGSIPVLFLNPGDLLLGISVFPQQLDIPLETIPIPRHCGFKRLGQERLLIRRSFSNLFSCPEPPKPSKVRLLLRINFREEEKEEGRNPLKSEWSA